MVKNNSDLLINTPRDLLQSKWASIKNVIKLQPINLVRDYFGEEIAFYFAWQGSLIFALWIPAIIGLIFFFIGISISVEKANNLKNTTISTTNSTLSK